MDRKEMVLNFWSSVIEQNAEKLKIYFHEDALINWHNTNECFTLEEYIVANCQYPGQWCGQVERIEVIDSLVISVTKVWSLDMSASFHATSFIKFSGDKIIKLDEYWGDDGEAPQWRKDKKIGRSIE